IPSTVTTKLLVLFPNIFISSIDSDYSTLEREASIARRGMNGVSHHHQQQAAAG
ncbi:hypothetical protein L9F63_009029, partial [Diploptera punctata]